MNKVLEVIFDYICPYCYRIHHDLKAISEGSADLEFVFVPCESHPRPERYGMHSDLCVRGMYHWIDRGLDVWQYHDLIYRAVFVDGIDVERADSLSAFLESKGGIQGFESDLAGSMFQRKAEENNRYAWGQLRLAAVPSLRMGDRVLPAVPEVGLTAVQMKAFINRE